ncbi:MAG: peptidoglycan DD-metalloendopeptidase family protein [Patescibacteria group bacterium]|jgi:murein DD-endopeptidase MepM/ murein hydrolase activator NlpD
MRLRRILAIVLLSPLTFGAVFPVVAQVAHEDDGDVAIKETVDDLNEAVKDKRGRIKELDTLIGGYRSRIKEQEASQLTLENEVALLDNRIREKELDIQRAKTEIETLNLEIEQLGQEIAIQEDRIAKHKDLIAEFVRRTHQSDEVSTMDVLLTRPSLSSFFNRIDEMERLQKELGVSIEKLKGVKDSLDNAKRLRDQHRADVTEQENKLRDEQMELELQRNTKTSLVSETAQSQEEFQRILYELKQQQQITSGDISRLEEELKDTLDSVDESLARGDILLNWPLNPAKGISASFHDPSYPFRRLFEHPGTDIPAPVGTAVKAAAGGYVAWNKTGKQYGNYTMIVHPGGIATIYAHLSKFVAKADTYVDRGDVIGLSGGRPGDQGAGLSTGPHLHFEVRQNGIPVNAENFLPGL